MATYGQGHGRAPRSTPLKALTQVNGSSHSTWPRHFTRDPTGLLVHGRRAHELHHPPKLAPGGSAPDRNARAGPTGTVCSYHREAAT